jgi:hypothetical protein
MDFSHVDSLAYAALTFAVIGTITFVRALYARKWETATVIAAAAVAGWLWASAVKIPGFTGFLIGLNGSGLITTVSSFGKALVTPVEVEDVSSVKGVFKS